MDIGSKIKWNKVSELLPERGQLVWVINLTQQSPLGHSYVQNIDRGRFWPEIGWKLTNTSDPFVTHWALEDFPENTHDKNRELKK